MSLIVKLVISLVIATIAYTLSSLMATGTVQLGSNHYGLLLLLAFFIATAATALLVRDSEQPASSSSKDSQNKDLSRSTPNTSDANREQGQVKWFNVSKGFGFIVKDDGEEIFVHFRSIRGEGRRGLSDGQRVNFIVEQSDKGPQAEDVVAED
jgi:CspA family cold shock protein